VTSSADAAGGAGGGTGGLRIVGARYRLDEVIGRGGMSTVYRGLDLSLDRTVAVKVALDPLVERDPVYVARFKREARAAAALSHPGVVTVYDAGHDGPTRFIVMEYVRGRDLAELLRQAGPLAPARAAQIAAQIADTLAAAHAAGIIHRDVKPGNVMITDGGSVKVLDFGIARFAGSGTLTQTAAVLGTAPYMSPEQAMGQPADARSDIYSLGCVLYEMLTGKPPFMADLPAAVMHQHVRVAPKPPSALEEAIPPALDALVLQMLAKSPEDRPQTGAEVRDRLLAPATAATVPLPAVEPTKPLPVPEALDAAAARPQAAAAPLLATVPNDPAPPTRPAPPPPRRHRGLWAIAVAIVLALAGAAVALALNGGSGSSSSTSTGSHSAPGTSAPSTGTSSRHSTSTPGSSSSSSTTTRSSSTTRSSTAPTTTITSPGTTPTTSTTTPGTTSLPPGQGGTPPGQAKKGKTK
jgi:eukaryotic-like serine/threonine-protein kinase